MGLGDQGPLSMETRSPDLWPVSRWSSGQQWALAPGLLLVGDLDF